MAYIKASPLAQAYSYSAAYPGEVAYSACSVSTTRPRLGQVSI